MNKGIKAIKYTLMSQKCRKQNFEATKLVCRYPIRGIRPNPATKPLFVILISLQ